MKPQLEVLNNLASKVKTARYSKRELIVLLLFEQSSSISSTLGPLSCQTQLYCCETVLFPNSSNYVFTCVTSPCKTWRGGGDLWRRVAS